MERSASEVGRPKPYSVLDSNDVCSSGDEADPSHYFDSSDIVEGDSIDESPGITLDHTSECVRTNTNSNVVSDAILPLTKLPTSPAGSSILAATTLGNRHIGTRSEVLSQAPGFGINEIGRNRYTGKSGLGIEGPRGQ